MNTFVALNLVVVSAMVLIHGAAPITRGSRGVLYVLQDILAYSIIPISWRERR